jgi:ABC-type Na+ efflux pump permease subunit
MVKRIGKFVLLLAGAFITVGAVITGAFMLAGAVAAAAVLLLYASVVVLVRRITRRTGPRPSLTAG